MTIVRFIDYLEREYNLIVGNGENFIIILLAILKFSYYLYKPRAYGFNWRYIDDDGNIVSNGYLKARKK